VAFGDSITAGYNAPHRRGYVELLGFRLGSRIPRVWVANCGKKTGQPAVISCFT